MGLLTEVLLREPAQRLVELTNADNPGGLQQTAVAGTSVAVTSGSTQVVGTATSFLSLPPPPFAIQFASQPGVTYVVASVQDNTHLTLAQPYAWVTNGATSAVLPAINYQVLQQAVWDAQQKFQERTNFPFDDTTQNALAANPSQLNKCFLAGVKLVVAYLYSYRGLPFPGSEGERAWKDADADLREILNVYGDGAFAVMVTDSNFNPSQRPPGSLPDTDRQRMGSVVPSDLSPGIGPGGSNVGGPGDYWGGW